MPAGAQPQPARPGAGQPPDAPLDGGGRAGRVPEERRDPRRPGAAGGLVRRGAQRLAGAQPVQHPGAEADPPPGRGAVPQRPAGGGGRAQEPRRRKRRPVVRLQPATDLQGRHSRPVPEQCAAGHQRWPRGPRRLAYRRPGALHGLAHHRRRDGRSAGRHARAGDAGARAVPARAAAGLPAPLHPVRGRGPAGQEGGRLSPVPRGARGGRERAGGLQLPGRCRPARQGRRGVAHAGRRQEHRDDLPGES